MAVLVRTEAGLYCPAGDFHIDPDQRVDRAVITHGHSDHCRWGMGRYLCAEPGLSVLRTRLGDSAPIDPIPYGQALTINGVRLSLHPAGHLLGSAQVRIEVDGEVWVVTGDYKTEVDRTCDGFELVRCHGLVTETTFGLPIYRWEPQEEVFGDVESWRSRNASEGYASVLLGYSLGKAQRILAGLDDRGPILVHESIQPINDAYRWAGVRLPKAETTRSHRRGHDYAGSTVVAPPGVVGSSWLRSLGPCRVAFFSGWMALRRSWKQQGLDWGFVLSDHVDWPSLMHVVEASGAEVVWCTHGYSHAVARHLSSKGVRAVDIDGPDARSRGG